MTIEEIAQYIKSELDYKTRYENFRKKSGVVISQLRADRDRLQETIDKIRAEIVAYDDLIGHNAQVQWCLKVIDKYKTESEE